MTVPHHVKVGPITIGNDLPFVLISGPCQIESRDHALFMADALARIAGQAGVPFIFKSSFDKANRTSVSGQRGVGIDAGLAILAEVKATLGCPVLTDVHDAGQVEAAAQAVDILQIPAFLCRQTDLLVAAAETGCAVNVKKGQFLPPWDAKHVVGKVTSAGNPNVLVTERGSSFGYGRLVVDMAGFRDLAETGCPVVFDATHSVQRPGGADGKTGGDPTLAPMLARSAAATGLVDGFFFETHPDPDSSPSDGQNMIRLEDFASVLSGVKRAHSTAAESQS